MAEFTKLQSALLRAENPAQANDRKERIIISTGRVAALLDPFTDQRFGAVVFPRQARPGVAAHMADLPLIERLQVQLVAHHVGKVMLFLARHTYEDGEELRLKERVDGFQIPDHAHVVLGIGARNESRVQDDQISQADLDDVLDGLIVQMPSDEELHEQSQLLAIAF